MCFRKWSRNLNIPKVKLLSIECLLKCLLNAIASHIELGKVSMVGSVSKYLFLSGRSFAARDGSSAQENADIMISMP